MQSIVISKNKTWLILLFVMMLFVQTAIPVQAAEDGTNVEIRVKVGSSQMKVNGEAIKIQAPYEAAGNLMVPLSVFTNKKSFGAKVELTNNKVLKITYQKKVVVLTLGSKKATINGKKTTLTAAPASKNSVTMVPMGVIAKAFGASVSKDTKTKESVIKFKAASSANGTTGSSGGGLVIDSDAGKSKIGDSYYGWSMNYPTGLIQNNQSPDGDILVFRDVKNEYYLGIFVEAAKDELTVEEKRSTIYDYFIETEKAVDKKTITGPDKTYERIVTKDKNGYFYEYRAIQANGYLYIVVFGKKATEASELDRFSSLLDSFSTTYNRSDSSLKDLTQIIDGFKTFTDEDYGLSVKLPKEWEIDDEASTPWFYTDDAYMYLDVTSIVSGDTLDAWIKRKQQRFEEAFAPEYRNQMELKDVIWNGIPAKALKLSYSFDTELWWEEYEIFAIQGDYRYYTEVAYYSSEVGKYSNLLDTVLRTSKVDFAAVEKNFGEITDDQDNADRSATVTKTSDKYGYSVTLPQYWYGSKKNFEEDVVEYSFSGGYFGIDVWDETYTFDELSSSIDEFYKEELSKNSKARMIENQTLQFAGYMAKKVIIEDKTNDDKVSPNRSINYFVLKDGKVYTVWGVYFLANGSDFNIKNIEAAINSFKFN